MLNATQFSKLKNELRYSGIEAITSPEDLLVLGSTNLKVLVSNLRSSEKQCSYAIEKGYEKLAFFEGKSGKDFEALASTFERPVVKMAPLQDRPSYAVPVDADSQLREKGTTTFNLCGWCQHTSSESRFGTAVVDGYCSLSGSKIGAPFSMDMVHADTPCKFPGYTAAQCEDVAQMWRKHIEESKSAREEVRALIKALQRVAEGQPERPLLPTLRAWNHFEFGESIVVFVANWDDRKTDAQWVTAKVIKEYRSQDGMVSFVANQPFHSGDFMAGAGGCGHDGSPVALRKADFQALRAAATSADESSQRYFEVFMRAVVHTPHLNAQLYREALKTGKVAE